MIKGDYNILYIKIGSQFLPVSCLTSNSFSEQSDMIDSVSMNSASWKTSRPTNQGYNISFDGLIENTNFTGGDSTKISLDRLRVLKRTRTRVEWKAQEQNSSFFDVGFGYITTLSKNANIDEFISFSANIEGFGSPINTSADDFKLQYNLQFIV
jgi:hypothetical protein